VFAFGADVEGIHLDELEARQADVDAGLFDLAAEEVQFLEQGAPRARLERGLDGDGVEVQGAQGREARPVAEHQRVEAKLPQGGGAWTSDGRCGEEARDDHEAPCGGRQVQCPCAPVGVAAVGVDVDLARVGELDDASPMATRAARMAPSSRRPGATCSSSRR
jgi:hypothetical protein